MSNGADAPAVPLKHSGRLRASWRRRLARLTVLGCLLATGIVFHSDIGIFGRRPDCASVAGGDNPTVTVQICRAEYLDTHDPATGARLTSALVYKQEFGEALDVASQLLDTSARSDALQALGRIYRAKHRNDEALAALHQARSLHLIEHRPREIAVDATLLSLIYTDRGDFVEALRLADEGIVEARCARDRARMHYGHMAATRALIQLGFPDAAKRELDLAEPLTTSNAERSDLEYQKGNLHQSIGDYAQAIAEFRAALRYRGGSPSGAWRINTELNLAYAAAEYQQLDDAQRYLEIATTLDTEGEKELERLSVGARIAHRRHDQVVAASLIDKYFKLVDSHPSEVDPDDQIDAAALAAEIELDRRDLERAAHWAGRGVDQAEQIRKGQSTLELRPWVLSGRRAPYELLFTALARSGRSDDAAIVFGDLQGRTLEDALATPRPQIPLERRSIADRASRIGEWFRATSEAAFAKRSDSRSVLATLRSIDLLALIAVHGEVWCLTANHGPLQLSRIEEESEFKARLADFLSHPTEVEAASKLGELLPETAFQKTQDVLYVLVDGRLGAFPAAALRRDGRLLVAQRPIVHVLRFPDTPCVRVARARTSTVLADPRSNLGLARAEGIEIASLLQATLRTGAAANKDALCTTAHDGVLHIAAHGAVGIDSAEIELADGPTLAVEISAEHIAPSLVVLSACDAASSNDLERAGSLASGFLAAGTQHVVATMSGVTDAGVPEISARFYRAGGVADPARALATVQAELASTGNRDWPFFAVFGSDVCRDVTSDHQP